MTRYASILTKFLHYTLSVILPDKGGSSEHVSGDTIATAHKQKLNSSGNNNIDTRSALLAAILSAQLHVHFIVTYRFRRKRCMPIL